MVILSEWPPGVFLCFRCRVSFCAALGVFPLLKLWLWMVTMRASDSPLLNIPRGRRVSWHQLLACAWNQTRTHPHPHSLLLSFRAGSAERNRIPGIVRPHLRVMFSTDSFQKVWETHGPTGGYNASMMHVHSTLLPVSLNLRPFFPFPSPHPFLQTQIPLPGSKKLMGSVS